MTKPLALGLAAIGIGFAIGYLVGFGIGQATRSRLSESIKTKYEGGAVNITIPVKDVITGGIVDYFGGR